MYNFQYVRSKKCDIFRYSYSLENSQKKSRTCSRLRSLKRRTFSRVSSVATFSFGITIIIAATLQLYLLCFATSYYSEQVLFFYILRFFLRKFRNISGATTVRFDLPVRLDGIEIIVESQNGRAFNNATVAEGAGLQSGRDFEDKHGGIPSGKLPVSLRLFYD